MLGHLKAEVVSWVEASTFAKAEFPRPERLSEEFHNYPPRLCALLNTADDLGILRSGPSQPSDSSAAALNNLLGEIAHYCVTMNFASSKEMRACFQSGSPKDQIIRALLGNAVKHEIALRTTLNEAIRLELLTPERAQLIAEMENPKKFRMGELLGDKVAEAQIHERARRDMEDDLQPLTRALNKGMLNIDEVSRILRLPSRRRHQYAEGYGLLLEVGDSLSARLKEPEPHES